MKTLLLLFFFSLSLFSQDIKKNLKPFTKIDINLNANTKITFGDDHYIEISGEEEDLDRIEIDVRHNTLIVKTEGSNSWGWFKNRQKSRVEVRITIKNLEDLDVSGAGDVMLPMLDQDDLKLDVSGVIDLETGGRVDYLTIDKSGAGNVYLKKIVSKRVNIDKSGAGGMEISGVANRLKIDCSGASSLDFEDFVVEYLDADMSGANSLRITVNKEVSADLSGASSVRFKGDAEIVYKDTSGASSVKRFRN